MKTRIILAMVMLFSVVAAGPALFLHAVENKKPAKQQDVAAVAKSGNDFAVDLYARLAGKSKGNLFFSPASIETALAMTYAGARGRTGEQMYLALHLPITTTMEHLRSEGGYPAPWKKVQKPWGQDRLHPAFGSLLRQLNTPLKDYRGKPAYQLIVSNALWGQKGYPFRKEFTQLVKANYGAGLNDVNFNKPGQACGTINDWVAEKTKDKIKDLIPQGVLTPLTRLVLTNAIYFKSNWASEFKKRATKDGPFHLSAEKQITVPLMNQQKRFGYMETDTFQAIEMPYKRRDLSMIVFLPKKVDGLAAVEKTLTVENLARWLKQLKAETVKVTFPKYKLTSQFRLAEVLKAMGMTNAFNAKLADFSGMTTVEERLWIAEVIHKAFVAVDEQGTEAAAATAVIMRTLNGHMGKPATPKIFKADHPFLFLIRHNATGSILFMGRVMNPKE
jgi:serpin B